MKTLAVLGATLLGAAGLTACTVATPTVSTSPASGSSPAAHHATASAQIGSTVDLAGFSAGEKMAVKVVRVTSHAHGSNEFYTPDHGNRFYAVQFRLTDVGSRAYSDDPDNSAQVIDSTGQSYQPDFSDVTGCQTFPATENIAVGSSGLGCIVFQVPKHAKITGIQFTLDSGMASQTGQWKA